MSNISGKIPCAVGLASDIPSVRKFDGRAIEQDGGLMQAHWAMALAERDFDETAKRLGVLQEKFGVEVYDLTTVPACAEFVQSP